MARMSNLNTIRHKQSAWSTHWSSNVSYSSIVLLDNRVTEYLIGLFYSLKMPTSYFIIRRFTDNFVLIEADILIFNFRRQRRFLFVQRFFYLVIIRFRKWLRRFVFSIRTAGQLASRTHLYRVKFTKKPLHKKKKRRLTKYTRSRRRSRLRFKKRKRVRRRFKNNKQSKFIVSTRFQKRYLRTQVALRNNMYNLSTFLRLSTIKAVCNFYSGARKHKVLCLLPLLRRRKRFKYKNKKLPSRSRYSVRLRRSTRFAGAVCNSVGLYSRHMYHSLIRLRVRSSGHRRRRIYVGARSQLLTNASVSNKYNYNATHTGFESRARVFGNRCRSYSTNSHPRNTDRHIKRSYSKKPDDELDDENTPGKLRNVIRIGKRNPYTQELWDVLMTYSVFKSYSTFYELEANMSSKLARISRFAKMLWGKTLTSFVPNEFTDIGRINNAKDIIHKSVAAVHDKGVTDITAEIIKGTNTKIDTATGEFRTIELSKRNKMHSFLSAEDSKLFIVYLLYCKSFIFRFFTMLVYFIDVFYRYYSWVADHVRVIYRKFKTALTYVPSVFFWSCMFAAFVFSLIYIFAGVGLEIQSEMIPMCVEFCNSMGIDGQYVRVMPLLFVLLQIVLQLRVRSDILGCHEIYKKLFSYRAGLILAWVFFILNILTIMIYHPEFVAWYCNSVWDWLWSDSRNWIFKIIETPKGHTWAYNPLFSKHIVNASSISCFMEHVFYILNLSNWAYINVVIHRFYYVYWVSLIVRRARSAMNRVNLPEEYEDAFYRAIPRPKTLEAAIPLNLPDVIYLLQVTWRFGAYFMLFFVLLPAVFFDIGMVERDDTYVWTWGMVSLIYIAYLQPICIFSYYVWCAFSIFDYMMTVEVTGINVTMEVVMESDEYIKSWCTQVINLSIWLTKLFVLLSYSGLWLYFIFLLCSIVTPFSIPFYFIWI